DENWVEAQARRPIQLGSRHRDRGFRENAGWAGRPCGLGCEPDLLCGRPCDLPGCAESTNPSLSFCPPGLPPTTIEEEATCDREDVRIVVELWRRSSVDDQTVTGSAISWWSRSMGATRRA